MKGRLARWLEALGTQLWPLPVFAVVLSVALGTALPALDAAVDGQLPESVTVLLFSGGPEAARSVLEAISGSLITVTSLTFSLTVVTLQLASSQFSPRLLRTFSADRFVHATLALFLAAFAFALTVLRSVRAKGSEGAPFVPEISVTVAFVLAIASVIGLVLFLAHLTREIRVETMMRRVNVETQETLDRVFPQDRPPHSPGPAPAAGALVIRSDHSGFLTSADKDSLLRCAVDSGAVIHVEKEPGSSLVEGVPFATAWPLTGSTWGPETEDELRARMNAAITTGHERTKVQDVGFGFRQLVDVAARALSPGINDPTTAVHVLGHLSALLCRLAGRNPGPEHLIDNEGRVRVMLAQPGLEDLLDMAMTQPRIYGAADPEVTKRLLTLLEELAWCDPHRRYAAAIHEQRRRMHEAITTGSYTPAERKNLLNLAETTGPTSPGG